MKKLMTKYFAKWASKQKISEEELSNSLTELQSGNYEANLGGCLYKKRIRFEGLGKSSSGRAIICYKKDNIAIYIYGFSKNDKSNLTIKELTAFKALSKILIKFSATEIEQAIVNGNFIEVMS